MSDVALSLCMIVKDEERHLPRALSSVQGVVDEVVVVDTGSCDGTVDLARQAGARLCRFEWTGSFADARNHALEQARGEWALIMDADEALHPEDSALLRTLVRASDVEAYICTVINYLGQTPGADVLVDHRISLFRRRPAYRYSRALHETIQEQIQAARPGARIDVAPLRLLHYGYLEPELARKGKRSRNQAILAAQLAANPGDPFLQYALATECMALGELAEAQQRLKEALEAIGPDSHLRSDLLQKLAACADRSGAKAESFAWLAQAAEEFPSYTDIWFQLAGAYTQDHRWTEAEACLRLCLALGEAPAEYNSWQGCGSFRAWEALGQVYAGKGSRRSALRAYANCLRANPQYTQVLHGLARLIAALSPEEAVPELSQHFHLGDGATAVALAAALRRAGADQHAHLLLRSCGGEPTPAWYEALALTYLAGARRFGRDLC